MHAERHISSAYEGGDVSIALKYIPSTFVEAIRQATVSYELKLIILSTV